jgi:hypothetical protein
MQVLNKRTDKIPPDAVYVGRPSKWGNPFILSNKLPRHIAVNEYRRYLLNNLELMASLSELKGRDLVCWCAPLPCHADVLLELANPEFKPVSHKG